jgi:hypothetical protein
MESHLRTEIVVGALRMDVWRRKPAAGLVHHFDQGDPAHRALFFTEAQGGRDCTVDGKNRDRA